MEKWFGSPDDNEASSWDSVIIEKGNGERISLPGIARVSVNMQNFWTTPKDATNTILPREVKGSQPKTITINLTCYTQTDFASLQTMLEKLTFAPGNQTLEYYNVIHPAIRLWKIGRLGIESISTDAPDDDRTMSVTIQMIEWFVAQKKVTDPDKSSSQRKGARNSDSGTPGSDA